MVDCAIVRSETVYFFCLPNGRRGRKIKGREQAGGMDMRRIDGRRLAVDLLVILAVAAPFPNIYSAPYGVVALYPSSFVMDQGPYGTNNSKVA